MNKKLSTNLPIFLIITLLSVIIKDNIKAEDNTNNSNNIVISTTTPPSLPQPADEIYLKQTIDTNNINIQNKALEALQEGGLRGDIAISDIKENENKATPMLLAVSAKYLYREIEENAKLQNSLKDNKKEEKLTEVRELLTKSHLRLLQDIALLKKCGAENITITEIQTAYLEEIGEVINSIRNLSKLHKNPLIETKPYTKENYDLTPEKKYWEEYKKTCLWDEDEKNQKQYERGWILLLLKPLEDQNNQPTNSKSSEKTLNIFKAFKSLSKDEITKSDIEVRKKLLQASEDNILNPTKQTTSPIPVENTKDNSQTSISLSKDEIAKLDGKILVKVFKKDKEREYILEGIEKYVEQHPEKAGEIVLFKDIQKGVQNSPMDTNGEDYKQSYKDRGIDIKSLGTYPKSRAEFIKTLPKVNEAEMNVDNLQNKIKERVEEIESFDKKQTNIPPDIEIIISTPKEKEVYKTFQKLKEESDKKVRDLLLNIKKTKTGSSF